MDNFLNIYWLLGDNSILSVYDLSIKEVNKLKKDSHLIKENDLTYFITKQERILVPYQIEEDGGILYENLEDLKRKNKEGFKSSSHYFHFNPSYEDFLAKRFNYIDNLTKELNIGHLELIFSLERITYLESLLHQKNFKNRQEIEKLFLGLIAYLGECFIKKHNAKWFNPINNEDKASWIPLIELPSERIIDIFSNLFEGLNIYLEGRHMPMIWLQADLTQAKPKKHYTHPIKRDHFIYKYGYHLNKNYENRIPTSFIAELDQEQLKETFLNGDPHSIRDLPFPSTMSFYQLKNNKILLIMEPALKGYLYNSLEDLY